MQRSPMKLAQIAASVAVLATAFTLPAAARVRYDHGHRYEYSHRYKYSHRRVLHRNYHHVAARPLTVRRRYYRDPFHGPAAIITAPVTVAGMIVSLPFRVIGAVFPPYGNPAHDPLVLVGAPVHFAGQIAQFPFYAVDSAFGVGPRYDGRYYY